MQYLIFNLLFFLSFQVLSHGEDKPGPHGGNIKMPGAFHIEIVPINSYQVSVYLLDMHFKNPTLKKSTLDLAIGSVAAKCITKDNYYICDFPSSIDLNKQGKLVVKAIRENIKGSVVSYSLPLKLFKKPTDPVLKE